MRQSARVCHTTFSATNARAYHGVPTPDAMARTAQASKRRSVVGAYRRTVCLRARSHDGGYVGSGATRVAGAVVITDSAEALRELFETASQVLDARSRTHRLHRSGESLHIRRIPRTACIVPRALHASAEPSDIGFGAQTRPISDAGRHCFLRHGGAGASVPVRACCCCAVLYCVRAQVRVRR